MASYSIILRTQWQCVLKYNLINGFMKGVWIEASIVNQSNRITRSLN